MIPFTWDNLVEFLTHRAEQNSEAITQYHEEVRFDGHLTRESFERWLRHKGDDTPHDSAR